MRYVLLLTLLLVPALCPRPAGADELRDLTAQVLAAQRPRPGLALAPDGAQHAAERREALLLAAAWARPGHVPLYAIPPADRARLSNNVRVFVETWETHVGVATFIPHPLDDGGPMTRYVFLPEGAVSPFTVYAPTRLLALPTGTPTRVCGVRIRQAVLVAVHCKGRSMQARLALDGVGAYPIEMVATNAAGMSASTTVIYQIAQAPSLPSVPQGLGIGVRLTWVPAIPAEIVTYAIDRAPTTAGPYAVIDTVVEPTYLDPAPPPGLACYRVRALSPDGTASPPTTPLCFTTAPGPTAGDVEEPFTRTPTSPPIVSVPVPPYTCVRLIGGTSTVSIRTGLTVLRTVNVGNPPIGSTFKLRCQVTATVVNLYIDGVLRASVAVTVPPPRGPGA